MFRSLSFLALLILCSHSVDVQSFENQGIGQGLNDVGRFDIAANFDKKNFLMANVPIDENAPINANAPIDANAPPIASPGAPPGGFGPGRFGPVGFGPHGPGGFGPHGPGGFGPHGRGGFGPHGRGGFGGKLTM